MLVPFKEKILQVLNLQDFTVERKGFEPSKQSPVYTLSKRAPSTTRTPL